MFFRMLKKDLKDKLGLNVTLFIFVVLAAILAASGTVLLYARLGGDVRTYESCNTSDMMIMASQNVEDKEAARDRIQKRVEEIPEKKEINLREVISIFSKNIEFEKVDEEDNIQLKDLRMALSEVPKVQNLPYDMEDAPFFVENGCVAIPQNLQNVTETKPGDTIKITTQMGNVYEFEVSVIYKNPSAQQLVELYFSPADFEVLCKESPLKTDLYEVQFENIPGNYVDWVIDQASYLIKDLEEERSLSVWGAKAMAFSDDGIIGLVVAVVMMIVAVFMILMIFITIGFTLKSAIKREEKEIGMMKAIGAYSLSYQAMFAAKYLAFAVVGGLIGLPAALPLTRKFISAFMIHIIYPDTSVVVLLSVGAVLAYVLIIIGFIFLTLRRMNKITVMDAIHGENKGERFHKLSGFFLHKRKHMKIPLFLAVSDICGRLKRYIYLILAYVMGIGSILLVLQMRDSVLSVNFMKKYMQKGPIDFVMRPDEVYMEKMYQKYGSYPAVVKSINDKFEKNGIPAQIEYYSSSDATLSYGEREYSYYMLFGEPDTKEIVFQKGNAPLLENEVALPCYQAENAGIEIGDRVSIEYKKIAEDGISRNTVKEDFIVTACFCSLRPRHWQPVGRKRQSPMTASLFLKRKRAALSR